MDVEVLIEKTKSHVEDYQYWLELEQEIKRFMDSEASVEDKRKLKYLGQTEKVYMICRGYEHKNLTNKN